MISHTFSLLTTVVATVSVSSSTHLSCGSQLLPPTVYHSIVGIWRCIATGTSTILSLMARSGERSDPLPPFLSRLEVRETTLCSTILNCHFHSDPNSLFHNLVVCVERFAARLCYTRQPHLRRRFLSNLGTKTSTGIMHNFNDFLNDDGYTPSISTQTTSLRSTLEDHSLSTYCTSTREPVLDKMLYNRHFHDLFTWLKLYPWHLFRIVITCVSSSGRSDYHSCLQ